MQRDFCTECGDLVVKIGVEGRTGDYWVSMQGMSEMCPNSSDNFHHVSEEENMDQNDPTTFTDPMSGISVTDDSGQLGQAVPQPVNPGKEPVTMDMLQQVLTGLAGQSAAPTFEESLAEVDPRDSEAALAMLDWLLRNGRLHKIGVLDGGQGYMFIYQEPKGTSKQGYTPGGTQGDRIVDKAVEQQREAGTAPKGRSTMCKKCFSAVVIDGEGKALTDDASASPECSEGGLHDPA